MTKSFSASTSTLSARLAARLLCSTAILFLPSLAVANPVSGQVTAGTATISQPSASSTTITQQTEKAIINWQSFSIDQGETTTFNQPDTKAITLNRVTGIDPSKIAGSLVANGQVWLINPNGIAFSKTARVNVAGLLATTIDIADQDFMSGNYRFSSLKNPSAMVTNAGHITLHDAGLAALVAPGVENSGVIEADLGQIQLSSAAAFTVDLYGDGLFNFTLDKQVTQAIKRQDGTTPIAAVSNSGGLIANGGKILMTANAASSVVNHAIDMTGYAQATSANVAQNGDIVLDGGSEGTVAVAGTLDASGKAKGQTGGTVDVTGQNVQLASTAKVDASGNAGGGTVHIGGDEHGAGPLRNAATTSVAQGAIINADAIKSGNGGSVAVWSDNQTTYEGSISARGGATGGNGGSAEVSSHSVLNYTGTTNLQAPIGTWGTLLLDPENVVIQASGSDTVTGASGSNGTTYTGNQDNSILTTGTLEAALNLGNVTVQTGSGGSQVGDITVASNLSWDGPIGSTTGSTLTLSAYGNIVFNSGVTVSAIGFYDNLVLRADNTGTGAGTVIFNGSSLVDFSSDAFGAVTIYYNPAGGYASPTDFSSNVIVRAGDGVLTSYMLVNNATDLQNLENNLSGTYALSRDIDASSISNFIPIGANPNLGYFSGVLDGLGHTISNLNINDSSDGYVGLFGVVYSGGIVRNLGLVGGSVTGTSMGTCYGEPCGSAYVGFLAGVNYGTISNVYETGSVASSSDAGGLVGSNSGKISYSHATGSVSGGRHSISDSTPPAAHVGGFVGENIASGNITNSYATGSVTATGPITYIGGFVGFNGYTPGNAAGTITNAYATGTVNADGTANGVVGGFVGENYVGSITQAYSTGPVTNGGGFSGDDRGTTTAAYWDINTSGQATSASGTGLTTVQLKSALPNGFDTTVWALDSGINSGYPYLLANSPTSTSPPPPPPTPSGVVTWSVTDANSMYGTLATLGDATLYGVSSSDSANVLGTVSLFSDQSLADPVTLTASLSAGTYYEAVTSLTGSAAGNYTLSSTGNTLGVLTIDPKLLTWTVADAMSTYGTLATLGNYTLSGVLPGDVGNVSGTVGVSKNGTLITLTSKTDAGQYVELVTGLSGSAAGNYTLATTGNTTGTLTVNKKALTWSMADATAAFGTLPIIPEPVLSGILAGDTVYGTPGIFSSTTQKSLSTTLPIGSYTEKVIELTGGSAENYALASTGNDPGTLTVYAPSAITSATAQTVTPIVWTDRTSGSAPVYSTTPTTVTPAGYVGGSSAFSASLQAELQGKLSALGIWNEANSELITSAVNAFFANIVMKLSNDPSVIKGLEREFLDRFTKKISLAQGGGQIGVAIISGALADAAADTVTGWLESMHYAATSNAVEQAQFWTKFIIQTAAAGISGGPYAAIDAAATVSIQTISDQAVVTFKTLIRDENAMVSDMATIRQDEVTLGRRLQAAINNNNEEEINRNVKAINLANQQLRQIDARLRATKGGPLYWLVFGG